MWRGAIVFVSILGMFWLSASALASEQEEALRREIERVASEITQTEVTVEYLEFSEYSGIAVLHGVAIANPEGFSDLPFFAFERATVHLDPTSIGEEVLLIEEVRIDEPWVQHETVHGQLNFHIVGYNAERYNEVTPAARKLHVENLVLQDAKMRYRINDLFGAGLVMRLGNVSVEKAKWPNKFTSPAWVAIRILYAFDRRLRLLPSVVEEDKERLEQVPSEVLKDALCEIPPNPHPSYAGPVWFCENRPEKRD